MKIALINTSDTNGGAARACFRLMESLNRQGETAQMLVQDKQLTHPAVFNAGRGLFLRPYQFFRSRYDKWIFKLGGKKPSSLFSTGLQGIDLTKHPLIAEADVIHLHWINHGLLSIKGIHELAGLNKPLVWTLHDMWAFTGGCHYSFGCEGYLKNCGNCPILNSEYENDLSRKVWTEKEKAFLDLDIKVISPSRWLAGEAAKSSLFRNKEIVTLPNAIDTTVFKPSDKKVAREKLNLSPDRKIILFGAENSTLDERKGFKYLLESFKYISENHSELSAETDCLVFGSEGNDYIRELLPFNIHFAGFISDEKQLALHYNAADVFVLPSLQDNLPNTIVEAMACGTPCIAFNTGGIPDLIKHMSDGYLAEPRSAEDLAAGIRTIFEDPNLMNKMSALSRQKMLDNFSYSSVAEKHIKFYRRIMSNRKGA